MSSRTGQASFCLHTEDVIRVASIEDLPQSFLSAVSQWLLRPQMTGSIHNTLGSTHHSESRFRTTLSMRTLAVLPLFLYHTSACLQAVAVTNDCHQQLMTSPQVFVALLFLLHKQNFQVNPHSLSNIHEIILYFASPFSLWQEKSKPCWIHVEV